jgi:AcrR family transcriptional regulator
MAREGTGRVYGGVTAAARDADRRRRLLDAGLELFGTRGVAEVSIADICAEARLTKRYFYQQFESFEAFSDAVVDDVVEMLTERTRPGRDDADHPERARISGFVETITADPRIARLVLVETFGAGGSLAGLRERLVHRAVELTIADFFPPGRARTGDPRRVRMAAYALSGACAELLLAWLQGDVEAGAEEIVDYLVGLFAAAVQLIGESAPRRSASGRTAP